MDAKEASEPQSLAQCGYSGWDSETRRSGKSIQQHHGMQCKSCTAMGESPHLNGSWDHTELLW